MADADLEERTSLPALTDANGDPEEPLPTILLPESE